MPSESLWRTLTKSNFDAEACMSLFDALYDHLFERGDDYLQF
jgi:hypothetical protein